MKLNPKKCEFGQSAIEYLDHKISSEGIKTIDSKIAAIIQIPRSTSKTEVRAFIGMTGHYRKFIKKNDAQYVKHLQDLVSTLNQRK